jgi:hypothetical protein
MKKLITAALLIMAVNAQAVTGNQYLGWNVYQQFGFIMGVNDALSISDAECIYDAHPTYGQLERIVNKYLYEHPGLTHHEMTGLYHLAMHQAFGCK